MKTKLLIIGLLLVAALIIPGVTAKITGNGAMSGQHYNLNLIGVDKEDKLPNDDNGGARIFVLLNGRSNIFLQQAPDATFDVIDADATDKDGAKFMLPAPIDVTYKVYVRELGKPGAATAQLQTCVWDETDVVGEYDEYCDAGITLQRFKGQSKFRDVTDELTHACVDITEDATYNPVCYELFDPLFEEWLWAYTNTGLKHVQLRFYPI
jgi:hypothetical protein